MLIYTHPDNIETLFSRIRDVQAADDPFIHRIDPFRLSDIEIRGDSFIEKERFSGKYRVLQNEFYTYWDGVGEPPSWAVYCGFVEPIMEPVLYIVNQTRMTLFTSKGIIVR